MHSTFKSRNILKLWLLSTVISSQIYMRVNWLVQRSFEKIELWKQMVHFKAILVPGDGGRIRRVARGGGHGGIPHSFWSKRLKMCTILYLFSKFRRLRGHCPPIWDTKSSKLFAPFIAYLKNAADLRLFFYFIQRCPPSHFKILATRLGRIYFTFCLRKTCVHNATKIGVNNTKTHVLKV